MAEINQYLRERLEARLKDPTMIDRVQAEIEQSDDSFDTFIEAAKNFRDGVPLNQYQRRYAGVDLNADGTIAIKGEAAEQLKALIRETLQEYGLGDWVRNNV